MIVRCIMLTCLGACGKTVEETDKMPDEFVGKLEGEERFDLSDAADVVGMTFDGGAPEVTVSPDAASFRAVATVGPTIHFLASSKKDGL